MTHTFPIIIVPEWKDDAIKKDKWSDYKMTENDAKKIAYVQSLILFVGKIKWRNDHFKEVNYVMERLNYTETLWK